MEPRNDETRKPSAENESTEINKDKLRADIAMGIKARLLGDQTVTYQNGDQIRRDCFLKSGNTALAITYESQENETSGFVKILVIDEAKDPVPGYHMILDPSYGSGNFDFYPQMSDVDTLETESPVEAAYLTKPPETADLISDKTTLQQGLLLIQDMIINAHPDEWATRAAKDWITETPDQTTRHRLDEINQLRPTIATHIDTALDHLPQVINDAFSD